MRRPAGLLIVVAAALADITCGSPAGAEDYTRVVGSALKGY